MNRLLKLRPAYKDYLWGGRRLKDEFNKDSPNDILAESWELSCHPDGPCVIANGPDSGMALPEYIAKYGPSILGENCGSSPYFPILVKLIDAKNDLSIQVHPDDAYALAHEGGYGKTEMWYVMDCDPGAALFYGFSHEISREQFAASIRDHTLTSLLRRVEVKRGDVFFIEAGTIHAIGAGILIAEIQQSSNLTYRVYDYNRLGPDGKPRELHVDKALDVTSLIPPGDHDDFGSHLATCDYFTVDKLAIKNEYTLTADSQSFHHLLLLDGRGEVSCGDERISLGKGESLFIAADSGEYRIPGCCEALLTRIP